MFSSTSFGRLGVINRVLKKTLVRSLADRVVRLDSFGWFMIKGTGLGSVDGVH